MILIDPYTSNGTDMTRCSIYLDSDGINHKSQFTDIVRLQ